METVFSKAADVIRERGWTQGVLEDEHRRVCLAGAVYAATGGDYSCTWTVYDEACRDVEAHLDGVAVGDWNDAPERTVEDVLTVLKELHVEAGGS